MKDLSNFSTQKSPLSLISSPILEEAAVKLYLKRDDLLHPYISGNKWRKLKYNLYELIDKKREGIITFGGAYSNHLHAVAAAGKEFNFKTVGIVRGEEPANLSSTLISCKEMGMLLHFVSRLAYKEKEQAHEIASLIKKYPNFTLLPEGGANELAKIGCSEIADEIEIDYQYLCVACGTATTLAGILRSNNQGQLLGFPILKGADKSIWQVLEKENTPLFHCKLISDYHFGGYAKYTNELIDFIKNFESTTGILLEQVYTGKVLFGVFDLVKRGFFPKGSTIIVIHTGGLQGRASF